MAGIDILDLVEATEVNETTDYLAVVDKSDTSQDVTGSTKRATVRKLLGDKALPSGDFVGTTDTQTITHKTISTSDNTFSGMLDWFYPVGTIYETTSSDLDTTTKMGNHFGGTWEVYGSGRVLVGKANSGTFATVGATMGEETHTLTIAEMPSHTHKDRYNGTSGSNIGYNGVQGNTGGLEVQYTGGGQAHNNIQPSIVVYRYRRIS